MYHYVSILNDPVVDFPFLKNNGCRVSLTLNNVQFLNLCSNPESCKQKRNCVSKPMLLICDGRSLDPFLDVGGVLQFWPPASSVLHSFLPACLLCMLRRFNQGNIGVCT